MSMMIQPARFVPPLPPEPVVFREYKNGSGINAISYTFTNMAIGTANAARWVIAAIFINHNTSRSLVSVTIGGVSATLLYGAPALSVPGGRWEFWKANVPTGTTASVAITANTGTMYDGGAVTYTCNRQPFFFDGEHDGTYTGTTFSVAIDVPTNGAVIAIASNDNGGQRTSWVGIVEDWFDFGERLYVGSADELPAETGRTVSVLMATTHGGFVGLAVLSISV